MKNLADDREAQALLAEATEAAEALHVAEAKWSAMTKASLVSKQRDPVNFAFVPVSRLKQLARWSNGRRLSFRLRFWISTMKTVCSSAN